MVNKLTLPAKQNDVVNKVNELVDDKQDTLVSGTNIKTINNASILGSGNIEVGGSVDSAQLSWYGTCSTTASTAAKVVVCDGFTLKTGVSIRVRFTAAQSSSDIDNVSLNVNSTGAIVIKTRGSGSVMRYCWLSGEVVSFTYDGTYWIMEDAGIASTTYYGYTKLINSVTSSSADLAITANALRNAVKMVYPYPAYASASTYNVGDRVINGFAVYECIVAIPVAEAWTAEHWKQLDAAQTQIDNLNATLGDIDDALSAIISGGVTMNNLTFNLTGTNQGYLTGLTVNGTTYTYSDFTNNSLTLSFPQGTSITWSATSSGVTSPTPPSGSLTLNSDSTVTIEIATSGGGYD